MELTKEDKPNGSFFLWMFVGAFEMFLKGVCGILSLENGEIFLIKLLGWFQTDWLPQWNYLQIHPVCSFCLVNYSGKYRHDKEQRQTQLANFIPAGGHAFYTH